MRGLCEWQNFRFVSVWCTRRLCSPSVNQVLNVNRAVLIILTSAFGLRDIDRRYSILFPIFTLSSTVMLAVTDAVCLGNIATKWSSECRARCQVCLPLLFPFFIIEGKKRGEGAMAYSTFQLHPYTCLPFYCASLINTTTGTLGTCVHACVHVRLWYHYSPHEMTLMTVKKNMICFGLPELATPYLLSLRHTDSSEAYWHNVCVCVCVQSSGFKVFLSSTCTRNTSFIIRVNTRADVASDWTCLIMHERLLSFSVVL